MRVRWLVALASAAVCVGFASFLAAGAHLPPDLALAIGLSGIALASYAWGIYSPMGGALVSGLIGVNLCWALAVQRTSELGVTVAAFAILMLVAIIQRRRRFKRWLQMDQLLDDLGEDRTVKDQAIRLAQQTRENLQKKHGRYQQLQSIAEHLSNLLDLGAITQLAVESAYELIGKSQVCLLFLVDTDRQTLSLNASRKADSVASVRSKHGDQFDRHVLRTHRLLLVNDVRRDFRFTMTGVKDRQIGSVISCPLLLGQTAEGVLRLDSVRPGAYTQDDLRFLDTLLDLVATSVANARLFAKTQHLAMTDGLTNLLLRRPFLEQIERELRRSERSRESMSVLMCDLDGFKAYNDNFGHTAGDAVLVAFADVLRNVVPPDGLSARYGGEEFAVLLPRAAREQARAIAEDIRQNVEHDLAKIARSEQAAVTVSIGVASFPNDAQADLELLRAADQRLYEAKRAGKNRVCS